MKVFRIFSPDMLVCLPDTTLLLRQRPFFVPDFTEHCVAQLCIAINIHRLGRSISTIFAPRYYDATHATLAVHFVAEDLLERLKAERKPWDVALGFDDAVAISGKPCLAMDKPFQATFQLGDAHYDMPSCMLSAETINSIISKISHTYTLRQGDVLLIPMPLEAQPVQCDTHLTCSVNNEAVLSFNIK